MRRFHDLSVSIIIKKCLVWGRHVFQDGHPNKSILAFVLMIIYSIY